MTEQKCTSDVFYHFILALLEKAEEQGTDPAKIAKLKALAARWEEPEEELAVRQAAEAKRIDDRLKGKVSEAAIFSCKGCQECRLLKRLSAEARRLLAEEKTPTNEDEGFVESSSA